MKIDVLKKVKFKFYIISVVFILLIGRYFVFEK